MPVSTKLIHHDAISLTLPQDNSTSSSSSPLSPIYEMSIRILLCGLFCAVALSTLFILYYSLFLSTRKELYTLPDSFFQGIRKPSQVLAHSRSRVYKVVSNTQIRTKFQTLETRECTEAKRWFSVIERSNTHWQKVHNRNLYLYSAFYDVRYRYEKENYHFIRVIASSKGMIEINEGKPKIPLHCHMWFDDKGEATIVEADIDEIWIENFNQNPPEWTYHSYLISCPVPHSIRVEKRIPSHVSISSKPCEILANYLAVGKDGLKERRLGYLKDQYLVCVKGMNFLNDVSNRLIEWMELNILLGASAVDFYVYHVHPKVWTVLRYYESMGKAKIVNLTLPGDQPNDVESRTAFLKENLWQKRRNELVPYNDCLYRNMYRYNFIIPLDIDEALVPVLDKTWSEMFKRIFRVNSGILKKYASFSVANAYFFSKWNQTIPSSTATYETDDIENLNSVSEPTPKGFIYTNMNNIDQRKSEKIEKEKNDSALKYHMLNHVMRSANFSLPGHNVKSFVATKNTLLTFNHYALRALLPNLTNNVLLDKNIVQLNHYQEKCSRYIISQCIKMFDRYATKDTMIFKYRQELTMSIDVAHSEIKNFT